MPNLEAPQADDPQQAASFTDHFDGPAIDSRRWQYPLFANGGTFYGRTQVRVRETAALPSVSKSNMHLTLGTYNPTGNPTGISFLGTQLQTVKSFSRGDGLSVQVRSRLRNPFPRGLIGGLFLFGRAGNGLNNEISFTMMSNAPGLIDTNVYAGQPGGIGRILGSFALPSGTLGDYHDYRIDWLPDRVEWFVDGELLRSETAIVPAGDMALNLSLWAPAAEWAKAYDSGLQPAASARANVDYLMDVDAVSVAAASSSPALARAPAVPFGVEAVSVPAAPLPLSAPKPSEVDAGYIFISYKREDFPRIVSFLDRIVSWGYPIWYDRNIPGGAEWDALIEEKVSHCMAFIVFLSNAAVESKWVRREIKFADSEDRPILGIRLATDVQLKHGLKVVMNQYQMIDATEADFSEELRKAIEYVRLL